MGKSDNTSDLAGRIAPRPWSMKHTNGEVFSVGTHVAGLRQRYRTIDYFMTAFPFEQLQAMVSLTFKSLQRSNQNPTGMKELLKYIGILVLAIRY